MSYSLVSMDGRVFEIEPSLWQRNMQEQALLLRYFALPLKEDDHYLWLGIESISNLTACEVFAFLYDKMVEPIELDSTVLKTALQQLSPQVEHQVDYSDRVYQYDHAPLYTDLAADANDEPVIRLLETIFEQAMACRASDIHLEPNADGLQVRFRIDGVLNIMRQVNAGFAARLISRVKLLAQLDIAEHRLPQDGRFQFNTTFNDVLDLRLSILPTQLGEKAVLRLQQNKPVELAFSQLGMNDAQQTAFQHALQQPQGLILVTGPTGSGKSISLYTALHYLNQPNRHILTAEDPIEISLPGIVQTQINLAIGLDFKQLLRSFLRQDPDVIMLGEIRDEESAAMAIRAAQTGHLVLSTLHTNDAPSAIGRLKQFGIQEYEIASSLLLVVAQRLLRRRCGCIASKTECGDRCQNGYYGRIGTYQFLQPKIEHGKFSYHLDFDTLYQSGLHKIQIGVCDQAEIWRVLGEP